MSDDPNTSFVKQFTDQKVDGLADGPKDFDLAELVDSKKIGVQRFSYDSDQAQNFDETNVKIAREGAKEILADSIEKAKNKAVQIREEARKLGYDEGHHEGFKKGEINAREEFTSLYKAFETHNRELSEFRRKMYAKVEREIIELVVDLTKKIISHELSTREDSIQQMIRIAVESVLEKESMTIKVNPADKEHAESFRPELHELFDEIKNITFEATPALDRGGCVIETNFGTIDARLQHLNEKIDEILTLTPVSFEEGQTQFPDKRANINQSDEQTESLTTTENDKKGDQTVQDSEESLNTDDSDLPELNDLNQDT